MLQHEHRGFDVALLVGAGCDLFACNRRSKTVLHIVAEQGSISVMECHFIRYVPESSTHVLCAHQKRGKHTYSGGWKQPAVRCHISITKLNM